VVVDLVYYYSNIWKGGERAVKAVIFSDEFNGNICSPMPLASPASERVADGVSQLFFNADRI
jgi:hypothetical protein